MGELGRRIARIKLTQFVDALLTCFPEVEVPEHLPALVRCLLPDHPDRTASFSLREHRWNCFGCGRGGDVVDFAQAYHDLELREAVSVVEEALGYGHDDNADLKALIALTRGAGKKPTRRTEWEAAVYEVEDEFFHALYPYLRCGDPVVYDLAWHDAGHVFAQLDQAAMDPPPKTDRGTREGVRAMRGWTHGWTRGIEATVLRATGKDRLDVATQGPLGRPRTPGIYLLP